MPHTDLLTTYTRPGRCTDPGPYAARLADLPAEVAALRDVVQNVMLHIFWAEAYGLTLSPARQAEVDLRDVASLLARVEALDDRPLTESRPPDRKVVGNCRDFSVLMAGLLKAKGIPARARCGFGRYFVPGKYEDHWIAEYWHAADQRWVLVDAQLDAVQIAKLGVTFDPLDMPRDQFVMGGQAWTLYRAGEADPALFGIFDMHGEGFIRGNLMRDLASLNLVEPLPWDGWGLCAQIDLPDAGAALLDRAAALTADPDANFAAIRELYADPSLHLPAEDALIDQRQM
jgi:hypothetical protein